MKKNVSLLILVVFILLCVIVFSGFMVSRWISVANLKNRYETFLKEYAAGMEDQQGYAEMADLFKSISEGDKSKANEYASWVRELTDGRYQFDDDEVFSVAKGLYRVYEALSEGKTDGIQDISCSGSYGKASIRISFIDLLKYKVSKPDPDKEMLLRGEKYEKYDGALGENLIKISITGWVSKAWRDQYSEFCVYEIPVSDGEQDWNAKFLYYSFEDEITILIGTDRALNVAEQEYVRINQAIGAIELSEK